MDGMTREMLRLDGVTKRYNEVTAASEVGFSLSDGETVALLGPSGCGKTTVLRLIGGFLTPDAGRIYLDGEDVTELEPGARDVATVFQSYGLFGHMRVGENVGYGLKVRGLPRQVRREKIAQALELVGLTDKADRYPDALSGGERQRVALARALVVSPKVLLLDEPLSNLDAKLRIEMREKIREIVQSLGRTMIFVTHDQEEAFALAQRVLVMHGGKIVEDASPQALYFSPQTDFVRDFIGEANLRGDGAFARYEDVAITAGDDAVVTEVDFRGRYSEVHLQTPEGERIAAVPGGDHSYRAGDRVGISIRWRTLPAPGSLDRKEAAR